VEDKWIPGETLFSLEEAAERATIHCFLLSDYAQMLKWPDLKPYLKEGDDLNFSHGFSLVYNNQTGVIPPENIDVTIFAPKGAGWTVRDYFLKGRGINASYGVHQDYTDRAEDRVLALGIAAGAGYLFPTTFEKEVHSDLTGERGTLLGLIWGAVEAQFELLVEKGHSKSEAFNETMEELSQSLMPIMAKDGMDVLLARCSKTAQRGALDWGPEFKKILKPHLEKLYERVVDGTEVRRVLEVSKNPNYEKELEAELKAIRNSEMWRTGAAVRSLRPERQKQ